VNRRYIPSVVAAAALALGGWCAPPCAAHEPPCPRVDEPVPEAGDTQDRDIIENIELLMHLEMFSGDDIDMLQNLELFLANS
jgi:hypothetical protein